MTATVSAGEYLPDSASARRRLAPQPYAPPTAPPPYGRPLSNRLGNNHQSPSSSHHLAAASSPPAFWFAAVRSSVLQISESLIVYVSAAAAYLSLYISATAANLPCARRIHHVPVVVVANADRLGFAKPRKIPPAGCLPPPPAGTVPPSHQVVPKPAGVQAGGSASLNYVEKAPPSGGIVATTASTTPCALLPPGSTKRTPLASHPSSHGIIRASSVQQTSCPGTAHTPTPRSTANRPELAVVPRPPALGSASLKPHRRAQSVLVGSTAPVAASSEVPAVLEHLRSAITRKQHRSVSCLLDGIKSSSEKNELVYGRIGCDDRGFTLMHQAAVTGFAGVLEALLAGLADAEARKRAVNATGATANNYTALHMAALKGDRATCEVLLSNGANPNCVSKLNATPLHLASSKNNVATAQLLLEYGADANICTQTGNTALMSAVHNQSIELVRLLVAAKANPRTTTAVSHSSSSAAAATNHDIAVTGDDNNEGGRRSDPPPNCRPLKILTIGPDDPPEIVVQLARQHIEESCGSSHDWEPALQALLLLQHGHDGCRE